MLRKPATARRPGSGRRPFERLFRESLVKTRVWVLEKYPYGGTVTHAATLPIARRVRSETGKSSSFKTQVTSITPTLQRIITSCNGSTSLISYKSKNELHNHYTQLQISFHLFNFHISPTISNLTHGLDLSWIFLPHTTL